MKRSVVLGAALMAATAAFAQSGRPPIADAAGREYCLFDVNDDVRQIVGTSIFRYSDRVLTAQAEESAKKLVPHFAGCLDLLDREVDKVKANYSAEKFSAAKAYVAKRRATVLDEIRAGLMRAGYRPSTAAPRRYTVCAFEMAFVKPVVESDFSIRTWSPIFYDREADSRTSVQAGGRALTKTEAEIIAAMRNWAKANYKPFAREIIDCDQYHEAEDAKKYRDRRLADGEDKPARITLPAHAVLPAT